MDDTLRNAPVGVVETTREGVVTDVDERAATTLELDRDRTIGTDLREAFPKSAAGTLREAFDGDAPTERSFEEYYPRIDRWLAVDVHVGERAVVYVRDRTDRRATEQTVDRLEQRLDRVQQIDSLIVTVLRRLVDAADRAEVAETVCERLGDSDPYGFVWVGERALPDDGLRVLASGGDPAQLRDEIDAHLENGDGVGGDVPAGDGLDAEEPADDGGVDAEGPTDDGIGGVGTAAEENGLEGTLPARAAASTGEPFHVDAIAEDDRLPRELRRAAFGRGLQSCLAVPLAYRGTVHGVVSVYSSQEAGFGDQERTGLETLGEVAGFAITAIRQEDLLVADTVTEVTLEVEDDDLPLGRVARATTGEASLEGAVPRGDGAVVCYVDVEAPERTADEPERAADASERTVESSAETAETPERTAEDLERSAGEPERTADAPLDAVEGSADGRGRSTDDGEDAAAGASDEPPASLAARLRDHDGVADVRWIREGADPMLQVTVGEGTPLGALAAWGATVRTAEYGVDSARVVAEAPPDRSVRRMLDAVDATVADATLHARTERPRTGESAEAFRDSLAEQLTERQRTALRTAFLADYFESPRGSTAEEVAESLDITGPTLLYHLRRAQRKLAAAFFETEPEGEP